MKNVIPSINDLESAALSLASTACGFDPYLEVYRGTQVEQKLVGEVQSLNRVAHYLFERAKERRTMNKEPLTYETREE